MFESIDRQLFRTKRSLSLALRLATATALAATAQAQLEVVSTSPTRNAGNVARATDIVIDFNLPIDASTLPPLMKSVSIFGTFTGIASGGFSLENGNTRLRFDPDQDFAAGEPVRVNITQPLASQGGSLMNPSGYAYAFTIGAAAAERNFTEIATYNLRDSPLVSVRIYGGHSTDLDNDGWVDLSIVNEDASDVRVLLNKADGSGEFNPYLQPSSPVGSVPSPNHAVDLNRDGETDIVTCNTSGNSVTVLFGNGDGTYSGRTDYLMASGSHGLAVFDADGDGDADVATSNSGASNITLRLNDGNGSLGPVLSFDGGGQGEYSLASADMNEDGLTDLVCGAQFSQRITVLLSNGDGTFTESDDSAAGGSTWMLVVGDVNGDGHLDVTSANAGTGNGSILFGDGAGNLSAPQTYSAPGFVTATDLGDLDGDGDQDWVLSSFGGQRWFLYENDGTGNFTLDQEFNASNNPGCALIFDFDRDHDLDLVLLDEIADDVVLMANSDPGTPYCFGDAGNCPCGNAGGAHEGCATSQGNGARLAAKGRTSVAADSLSMRLTQLPPNQFGVLFAGHTSNNLPFGDGLWCAAQNLFRFPITNAGASGEIWQQQALSLPGYQAGDTRYYQGWFRDPSGPCGTAFNLSNAVQVTATP